MLNSEELLINVVGSSSSAVAVIAIIRYATRANIPSIR